MALVKPKNLQPRPSKALGPPENRPSMEMSTLILPKDAPDAGGRFWQILRSAVVAPPVLLELVTFSIDRC